MHLKYKIPIVKFVKYSFQKIIMKKTILISFLLLVAINANAQFGSKSYYDKPFVSYVKASVSINNYSFDKDLLDLAELEDEGLSIGSTIGYNAVYGFQYSFVKNLGLYLGMELGVGTRGFNISYSETYRFTTLTHSAKASPQIGYKVNITDLLAIDAHIGAVVSYDFAGNGKLKWNDDNFNGYLEVGLGKIIDEGIGFNRFDVGINPGITLWAGPIGIDFTYQRGFLSVVSDENISDAFTKIYSSNFLLGLAFRF